MSFDVSRVRADFPILAREVNGKPLVYLDSAASAQKPRAVIDAMSGAMEHAYANVHRGLHTMANETTAAYEAAREKVAKFINAESPAQVVFTSNATDAINLVAATFGAAHVGEGDEIVLTVMEHHSNIVPWHFLRERNGAVLKWVTLREDGGFDMDAFEAALSDRTKMVAVTHMSNVLGSSTPAKEIARAAHARGIPVLFDGSQAVVHSTVNVQDIDADFYVFTGHKLYGPTGIGVLYGKREHLEAMHPYRGGGEMIERVTLEGVDYAAPPARFEAGTPMILEAIGLGAAIDYVESLGRDAIHAHEADLLGYATDQLQGLNWVDIYGTAPGKGSIISFGVHGAHAHDVATIIDQDGIAVRAGQHCAEPLMSYLNVHSTARASFGMYNTRGEVDRFVEALHKARGFLT
jgi:cysteine desulfurase/selenocysteine lyase